MFYQGRAYFFVLVLMASLFAGCAGLDSDSLKEAAGHTTELVASQVEGKAEITSVDLELLKEEANGTRFYKAEAIVGGSPTHMEMVRILVDPDRIEAGYPAKYRAGHDRIGLGIENFNPKEHGWPYYFDTVSPDAFFRGFFVAHNSDRTIEISDYVYIKPESTDPDAILRVVDLPTEAVISDEKEFEFEVESSAGVSHILFYYRDLNLPDTEIKYLGTMYTMLIPEYKNSEGTLYGVSQERFFSPTGVNPNLTDFQAQIVLIDNANNVYESEWFPLNPNAEEYYNLMTGNDIS